MTTNRKCQIVEWFIMAYVCIGLLGIIKDCLPLLRLK